MKIFLIGYMGSGKTTIGKALASQLNAPFYDLDDLITANAGHSISEIFEIKGEETFREMESTVLQSLVKHERGIIACGGGTPCFFNNMDWMKSNGLTIYLKHNPAQIIHHLKDQITHRPILAGKTNAELLNFIEQHLGERSPVYERAHVVMDGASDFEGMVEELRIFLQRFFGE